MRNLKLFTAVLIAAITFSACQQKDSAPKDVKLETDMDKASYSLGINIGQNLKDQNWDSLNPDVIAAGLKDVLTDQELKISQEEAVQHIQNLANSSQQQKGSENLAKSKAFLAENLKSEGVKETPSGLQYKVIREGTGDSPDGNDKVVVHYEGKLVDGTVFDSSIKRGEPITFPVNQVIPGWTEALQMMKEGAKWTLYIPPALGYGERGAGELIEPNSALIFEVELIEVQKQEGSQAANMQQAK